jgi:hypothetical protein
MKEQRADVGRGGVCPQTSGEAEPAPRRQLEAGPMVSVDGRGVTRHAV